MRADDRRGWCRRRACRARPGRPSPRSCNWPNSPPQAAFAQPVSVTVQWRSPGRRSCQKRAVGDMAEPVGGGLLDHLRVADRAAGEVEQQRIRRGGSVRGRLAVAGRVEQIVEVDPAGAARRRQAIFTAQRVGPLGRVDLARRPPASVIAATRAGGPHPVGDVARGQQVGCRASTPRRSGSPPASPRTTRARAAASRRRGRPCRPRRRAAPGRALARLAGEVGGGLLGDHLTGAVERDQRERIGLLARPSSRRCRSSG